MCQPYAGHPDASVAGALRAVSHQFLLAAPRDVRPAQVALNGCALPAEEGAAAAKVAASGSNRAKVKAGAAVFKGVKLAAEAPGSYVLRAGASAGAWGTQGPPAPPMNCAARVALQPS
jgi:hypothetical protein